MLRLRPTLSMPLECPGALSHPLNGTVLWAASGTLTAGPAAHAPNAAWPAPDAVQVMARTATEAIPRRTKLLFLIRDPPLADDTETEPYTRTCSDRNSKPQPVMSVRSRSRAAVPAIRLSSCVPL